MIPDRPAPSPEGAAPPLWPTTPDQDAEHLRLLSLFHTVLGCLAALLLEGFLAKYPDHKQAPNALYLLGLARVQAGDRRTGVADLRAFVEKYPSHDLAPAARRLTADTLVRYGDREELQEIYKTLMTQTPPTPEALADAASVAGRLGRPKDQEAAWR